MTELVIKLFYFPRTCALAIHVLLEEIGKPFELLTVDLAFGAQNKEPYSALNPKGKIPALLRDDGTLLTELPAIAWYLARTHPAAELLPGTPEGEARVLELMDYMVATVHMRGFTRIFRPGAFSPAAADESTVIQTGKGIVIDGFELIADRLAAKDYLLEQYSIADASLFYLECWAMGRAEIPLPANLAAHHARMKERPAVSRALATEDRDFKGAGERALAAEDAGIRRAAQLVLAAEERALQRRERPASN